MGVLLGLGFMKGEFSVLEDVYRRLEPLSNFKGSLLLEKIGNKVDSSKKLRQYEADLRRRSKPRFKDVCEAFEEFLKSGD